MHTIWKHHFSVYKYYLFIDILTKMAIDINILRESKGGNPDVARDS